MSGGIRRPRRMSRAPTPFGPPSLCAETLRRSAPRPAKSTGTWPAPAHASTWTSTPRSRAAAHTAATGCSVPTSWFASWTETRAVSSVIAAATSSASKRPSAIDADERELARLAPAGVEDARVLDRGGDDAAAEPGPAHAAPDRVVDGLGAARREDDLARAGRRTAPPPARAPPRPRPASRVPPRAGGPGRRGARPGTGASLRARPGAGESSTRDRGTRAARAT